MYASPASTAHASFFSYTGADCDPDLALPSHAPARPAPLWVVAVSSACVGAAMGHFSARRP